MGWLHLYNCEKKQDIINHIVRNFGLTDHSVKGNVLYGVCPTVRWVTDDFGDVIVTPDGGSQIIICLLDCDRSNPKYPMWGYKDMSEWAYPYYFDCPERILRQSTVPDESGWRAACRLARKAKAGFVVNQWYDFGVALDGETRWQYRHRERIYKKGFYYWRSEKGREYRIPNVAVRYKPVAVA